MDSNDLLEKELDGLTADIALLEEDLLRQIDGLAKAIPDVYAGYASMVRTLVTNAMQVLKPSAKTANRGCSYA